MLSFIIPAHNEEQHLGATIAAAHAAAETMGGDYEVVVVNDDSTDRTVNIAAHHGVRVLFVKLRHIAAVRNAGAAGATGDRLVFLDADTLLPAETLRQAMRALRHGAVGGGAYVRFDQPIPWEASAALWTWNVLSRVNRWAAGSFLFVRRAAFEAVGGFDEQFYAAEEIVLSQQLKRLGPVAIVPHPVVTSARKVTRPRLAAHWALLRRTLLTGGRNLRSRDGLTLWYD